MIQTLTISQFFALFPDSEACLEEIKKLRYPGGIYCRNCKKMTAHYKLKNRTAYACKSCRNQVYPLTKTIFEKTTTPLLTWFVCMLLMTQARGGISAKQLQRELGVTYKTAWRMRQAVRSLMEQNNGDLLKDTDNTVRKWLFFNKIEFTVVQKKETEKRV